MSKLYKTTIEIYTKFEPTQMSLSDLAQRAESGDSICDGSETVEVEIDDVPEGVLSFFNILEDE